MAVLTTLTGCQESPPKEVGPVQKLTVAYTIQPQCTLMHVAQAKGFFAEERLAVRPVMHTFGKAALQEVLDGKADLATAAETPIMFSILRGEKIFVLANMESSVTNNAALVLPH